MRLAALAATLSLGGLIALSAPSAGAGRRPTSPAVPRIAQWTNIPRYQGVPSLPRNYRAGQNRLRVVNVTADFTFTFNGDVGKVRTIEPPEAFDDKGNVKKHTAEELKALKGDTDQERKLPGYKSDIAEVQVGDLVQVALSVHKATSKAPADKPAGKKDPDADAPAKTDLPDQASGTGRWVAVSQLLGRVTKIDAGNTTGDPKLTVRVTGQVLAARTGRVSTNRNRTINPRQAQATVILIGRRRGGRPTANR
jgi:hypothetical protein